MNFVSGDWNDTIDVRDFIQKNYTPYDGDEFGLKDRRNPFCYAPVQQPLIYGLGTKPRAADSYLNQSIINLAGAAS